MEWIMEGSLIGFFALCGIAVVRVAFNLFDRPVETGYPVRDGKVVVPRMGLLPWVCFLVVWLVLVWFRAEPISPAQLMHHPASPPPLRTAPLHQEPRDVYLVG